MVRAAPGEMAYKKKDGETTVDNPARKMWLTADYARAQTPSANT